MCEPDTGLGQVPLQIDEWRIALSHRHDVGARQFPLATARLTPDDQSVIAETAPGREISQSLSCSIGWLGIILLRNALTFRTEPRLPYSVATRGLHRPIILAHLKKKRAFTSDHRSVGV